MEKYNQKIPEISVVVLCYKEGYRIENFVKRLSDVLAAERLDYEIVLVGNYFDETCDTTPLVVKELARNSARVKAIAVKKPKGGMMGWDARSGFSAASGQTLALIDGDGQMPPDDIPRIYRKLLDEKLDICKTTRKIRGDSFLRKAVSKIYNAVFGILFPGISDSDINSKPKIFTRAAYDKLCLESDDWFLDAEIMIKAGKYGLKYGCVPTIFRKNDYRASFINAPTMLEFIKNMIVYRIRKF